MAYGTSGLTLHSSGTAQKRAAPQFERSRALCARERGASVEHRGVGRTAPANPSFERTPLRGFARVSLRALRALRPHAGAAQLAPR